MMEVVVMQGKGLLLEGNHLCGATPEKGGDAPKPPRQQREDKRQRLKPGPRTCCAAKITASTKSRHFYSSSNFDVLNCPNLAFLSREVDVTVTLFSTLASVSVFTCMSVHVCVKT